VSITDPCAAPDSNKVRRLTPEEVAAIEIAAALQGADTAVFIILAECGWVLR